MPRALRSRRLRMSLSTTSPPKFKVDQILDHERGQGNLIYHVSWEGYPLSEATWEPEDNIMDQQLLVDYWAQHGGPTEWHNEDQRAAIRAKRSKPPSDSLNEKCREAIVNLSSENDDEIFRRPAKKRARNGSVDANLGTPPSTLVYPNAWKDVSSDGKSVTKIQMSNGRTKTIPGSGIGPRARRTTQDVSPSRFSSSEDEDISPTPLRSSPSLRASDERRRAKRRTRAQGVSPETPPAPAAIRAIPRSVQRTPDLLTAQPKAKSPEYQPESPTNARRKPRLMARKSIGQTSSVFIRSSASISPEHQARQPSPERPKTKPRRNLHVISRKDPNYADEQAKALEALRQRQIERKLELQATTEASVSSGANPDPGIIARKAIGGRSKGKLKVAPALLRTASGASDRSSGSLSSAFVKPLIRGLPLNPIPDEAEGPSSTPVDTAPAPNDLDTPRFYNLPFEKSNADQQMIAKKTTVAREAKVASSSGPSIHPASDRPIVRPQAPKQEPSELAKKRPAIKTPAYVIPSQDSQPHPMDFVTRSPHKPVVAVVKSPPKQTRKREEGKPISLSIVATLDPALVNASSLPENLSVSHITRLGGMVRARLHMDNGGTRDITMEEAFQSYRELFWDFAHRNLLLRVESD